ncbi:MAG: DUF4292 domain-containing protein [Ignavibacteriaceae bacterium]
MKKILFFFFISITSIVSLYINGCVPSKPTEEVELLPSERLINKLEANRRRIKTFEGNGILKIKSSQFNNSATFRVILSKPDSIYFTIMGPFGIELAQAVVTNENFIFYDALQNTAYEGSVNDDVLKNIFKVDLSFNDLIDAFIGSVNLTNNLYTTPSSYEVVDDKYVLVYIDSLTNVETKYLVDIRELGITDYSLSDAKGKEKLEGKYSNFELLEGVAVPYKIIVQNKKDNQIVDIEYKNMSANKRDIYINFNIPEDATIIKW